VIAEVHFRSIRSDWLAGNTLLPRLFVNSISGQRPLRLRGFPAQWIPVCAHYGIKWSEPRAPQSYLPLFSELPIRAVASLASAAKRHGTSRQLLEATAALDPVIADLVYIIDHKLAARGYRDPGADASNTLNTWHSFGRPEIIGIQERMCRFATGADTFLMLPCSRRRPYGESRTHVRLARQLAETGQAPLAAARVVVTALGVVPEAFWSEPLVMSYDAGAVDLWRVFQLLRVFFTVNRSRRVVDCLSFRPFSDMLVLLQDLGVVTRVERPLKQRWRAFYVDLQ
jgi:hypothetical protein